ncbi:hypothetical protein Tco_0548177 [Tanacetum coccineum]
MTRGRHSTSSYSTFGQPSSSHFNDDDDGNDEGTSRTSTPSPIRYVNSLTNEVPQVFQNPPNIDPHLEPFYTRQTEIINRQVQIRDEHCGGLRSIKKGVVRFGKKGKLAPRFVRPFEIVKKVGTVAYRLDLPEDLNGVHDTFHVSNLKKCLVDPTLQVPLDEIRVDDKLNFVEEHVEIMDQEFKKLKRGRIAIVKVRWNSKRRPEFTWEREDWMKIKSCADIVAFACDLSLLLETVAELQLVGFRCGKSFMVATLRALVHAGDKTSRDARSWYMISGDAKS